MDLHEALYSTRAMRRVSDRPIPEAAQARILDAAVRAPSGGNSQQWRFMLVDDRELIARLGPHYRVALGALWSGPYAEALAAAAVDPEATESRQLEATRRSAQWLADHFETVPLLLFPFSRFDPAGSSIYPAVWSAMLAARAEGIGSCLTSVLGAFARSETLELLGVPSDEGWTMAGCVTFGYPTGRWGVARRRPFTEVSYRNRWAEPIGLAVPAPPVVAP